MLWIDAHPADGDQPLLAPEEYRAQPIAVVLFELLAGYGRSQTRPEIAGNPGRLALQRAQRPSGYEAGSGHNFQALRISRER